MGPTQWPEMADVLSGELKNLRGGAGDVMKGFSAIAQAALKAGVLDVKTKELIALAISVAVRCDDCIAFHAKAAVERGATRFKPIVLTAAAAVIGAAFILTDPIFQGLAISLVFGLASSTALTLLVIPAIYVVLRDDSQPRS